METDVACECELRFWALLMIYGRITCTKRTCHNMTRSSEAIDAVLVMIHSI
jgi:hypothetical protein